MDATAGIVTVGKNTAELERVRNATKSYLEVKHERDPSDLHICSAMKTLERYIGNIPCLAQGSSKYDAWLQQEKEAAENRKEDERERISVLDQLSVYSQCLMTYKDFRHEDAVSVLEEVEEFKNPTPFEQVLFSIHTDLDGKTVSFTEGAKPTSKAHGRNSPGPIYQGSPIERNLLRSSNKAHQIRHKLDQKFSHSLPHHPGHPHHWV